jgi:hypothetical protein
MHIIDEGKEILRTPLECRRMLTLDGTQRTIQQELHFPDEFIHWGQDFMAHNHEKFFLLTEGRLKIVLGMSWQSVLSPTDNICLQTLIRIPQLGCSLAHAERETINLQLDGACQIPFLRQRVRELNNLDTVERFHQNQ